MIHDSEIKTSLIENSKAIVYDKDTMTWDILGPSLLSIDQKAFPRTHTKRVDLLQQWLEDSQNTVILLTLDTHVVGFTIARPVGSIWPERAHELGTYNISLTGVDPEYQGNGLVSKLMYELEQQLKSKGAEFVERNASVDNGYAGSIERHYGNRIVEQHEPRITHFGNQQFFRIKL